MLRQHARPRPGILGDYIRSCSPPARKTRIKMTSAVTCTIVAVSTAIAFFAGYGVLAFLNDRSLKRAHDRAAAGRPEQPESPEASLPVEASGSPR